MIRKSVKRFSLRQTQCVCAEIMLREKPKARCRRALALRHRDADAADLALRLDLHDLFAAVGAQVQRGGEARSLDEHADLAIAGGALQIAEDVAALLAPAAGDTVALAGDIAGQVELVAVAGAVQRLLQAHA